FSLRNDAAGEHHLDLSDKFPARVGVSVRAFRAKRASDGGDGRLFERYSGPFAEPQPLSHPDPRRAGTRRPAVGTALARFGAVHQLQPRFWPDRFATRRGFGASRSSLRQALRTTL